MTRSTIDALRLTGEDLERIGHELKRVTDAELARLPVNLDGLTPNLHRQTDRRDTLIDTFSWAATG